MARIPSLGPRGEGWTFIQAVLMVAIGIAAWWASAVTPNPDVPLAATLRAIGTVLLLGGLALVLASSALLRRARSFTALPRPIAGGSFVESGPYRWIRHPIYAGLIVAGFGVALIRLSPIVAIPTIALTIVLDVKRRREEAWLLERYPAYAAYRARTKALVPRLY